MTNTAPQDFWSDLLYTAVPRLVAAITAYSEMHGRNTARNLARHYHRCFDVSPIRWARAEADNAAFDAGLAVTRLGLPAAAVSVNGTLYTVNATGKISPCPMPGTRWAL